MTPKETKADEIIAAINEDIAEQEHKAKSALGSLEKLNITPEDFKKESRKLMWATFAIGYLKRIRVIAKKRDLKQTENIIRYHCYALHTKGNLSENAEVATGQALVSATLTEYIEMFFE